MKLRRIGRESRILRWASERSRCHPKVAGLGLLLSFWMEYAQQWRERKETGESIRGFSRFSNSFLLSHLKSRDGRIRTGDPLNPIQVRYRAAPRPEDG